jgi:hypothetical protein
MSLLLHISQKDPQIPHCKLITLASKPRGKTGANISSLAVPPASTSTASLTTRYGPTRLCFFPISWAVCSCEMLLDFFAFFICDCYQLPQYQDILDLFFFSPSFPPCLTLLLRCTSLLCHLCAQVKSVCLFHPTSPLSPLFALWFLLQCPLAAFAHASPLAGEGACEEHAGPLPGTNKFLLPLKLRGPPWPCCTWHARRFFVPYCPPGACTFLKGEHSYAPPVPLPMHLANV